MKAIVITHPGGPEVLQLMERPRPVITHNEVLIKVMAAHNRPDVFQRKGNYPPPDTAPADIPDLKWPVPLPKLAKRLPVGNRATKFAHSLQAVVMPNIVKRPKASACLFLPI